uniref:Uncharacterized protein n=1 Tax=Oryza punctata TaxID=4537 RepID=A0A0E0K0H3_ORYPU
MKRRDQEKAIAKLTSGARRDDVLLVMSTKKAMLAAVVAKCRELWEGLLTAGSVCGVSRSAADDDVDGYYFGRSYEFSCSATPVFAPAKGRRRRLPPCVGGRQAREMLREQAAMMSPVPVGAAGGRDGRSPPERSPQWWTEQEIDGLAEEFINRFYEQLRSQVAEERRPECKSRTSSPSSSSSRSP